MARSERTLRTSCGLGLAILLVLIASCAQVTGLSDDYRFDLDASSGSDASASSDATAADASAPDGGNAPADAGPDSGPAMCTGPKTASAETVIDNAGGSNLPAACKSCLAATCCAEVSECGADNTCQQSMKCVFGCQKNGNGRTQCLSGCKGNFAATVGPCSQQSCGGDCQLF